jgi:hypothetical protein
LKSVGLGPGFAWCAAFTSWVLDSAKTSNPTKKTAMARGFISKKSISAADVLRGRASVNTGYHLVIWIRGNGPYGHIGFKRRWKGIGGTVIEGNTSCGSQGSQYDGGSVCVKPREIQPRSRFRITHFEPIEYPPKRVPVPAPVKRVALSVLHGFNISPALVPVEAW